MADVAKRPACSSELAAKEKALNSYGPTAENGFVHIPIQQAIKARCRQVAGRSSRGGPGRQRPRPDGCGRVEFRPHVPRTTAMRMITRIL